MLVLNILIYSDVFVACIQFAREDIAFNENCNITSLRDMSDFFYLKILSQTCAMPSEDRVLLIFFVYDHAQPLIRPRQGSHLYLKWCEYEERWSEPGKTGLSPSHQQEIVIELDILSSTAEICIETIHLHISFFFLLSFISPRSGSERLMASAWCLRLHQ